MEIKSRQYPYPVLRPDSTDYRDCSFAARIEEMQEGTDLCLNFVADLKCDSLSDLIKEEKAKFVYHLECPTTGFRTFHKTSNVTSQLVIPSKNLRGKLQICPLILASTDLCNYSAADFDEDYSGSKFNIEEACILAIGNPIEKIIRKDINALAEAPSIFSISSNPDPAAKDMVIDLDTQRILIKLSKTDKSNFKILNSNPLMLPIINSIVLLPALIYTLSQVQRAIVDDALENYENNLWFITIKDVLRDSFRISVDRTFLDKDVVILAQKLLGHSITESLNALTETLSQTEDE